MQIKYRELRGTVAGPWQPLDTVDGKKVIPTRNMSSTVDFIEVEQREDFEVGDTFESSGYAVTILDEPKANIRPNGEEYKVYPASYKDERDGEIFHDYVSEVNLRSYTRVG